MVNPLPGMPPLSVALATLTVPPHRFAMRGVKWSTADTMFAGYTPCATAELVVSPPNALRPA
jgi:hypothetical protein